MTPPTPVILLAFANDPDDHLEMLTRERKAICATLQHHEDKRYIRVHVEPDAGINDLFALFNRFAGQISILHYGGHASGNALSLETASGDKEIAHAGGLARLMGLSPSLQLVFLNGCATRGQVKSLLDNGVKAVIATAVPINDSMATEFAEQFYQALASEKTIRQSFESACAIIASRYDDKRPIGEFRGVSFGDEDETVAAGLTWGLYLHPESAEAVAWKLPQQSETQVVVQGTAPSRPMASQRPLSANDGLIQTLFAAVAPFSPELNVQLEAARATGRQDIRTIRQGIIDAFPSPVGEQLRKLFASAAIGEARLRQLVTTYETLFKLFAFTSVSQLWDALHENPALKIADPEWEVIEAFKNIDAANAATFDYLALIVAIDRALLAGGVRPFIEESARLQEELTDEPTQAAHDYMDSLRVRLAAEPFPENEIASACVEGEKHLGTLVSDLAFLVGYKMATIKGIVINKSRHKRAEFRHRQVILDRVTADFVDSEETRFTFTDNESVILLKDLADVSRYLNLTPFVIDENALFGYESTKIYFYSHHDRATDEYHYYSIADPTDRRIVSDRLPPELATAYLPIKAYLDEFQADVVRR